MKQEEIIEQLKNIVAPYVQDEAAFQEISMETNFISDLQINSAHLVDVILDVEDKFNIRIENNEMEQMISVGASIEIIQKKNKKVIGNDVVDLSLAKKQKRWKTKAFQQKVLHRQELENTKNKPIQFYEFWKVWSIKEAAYKAHQRFKNHAPKVNPFDFYVEQVSENISNVYVKNEVYSICSFSNSKYIYSYTLTDSMYSFQNFKIDAATAFYSRKLKRNNLDNFIFKNQFGIPFFNNANQKNPISITHHGRYFAYVMLENSLDNFLKIK